LINGITAAQTAKRRTDSAMPTLMGPDNYNGGAVAKWSI
jgi:hypothetical protein